MAMVSWRGRAALAKHSPQRACAPEAFRKSATCAPEDFRKSATCEQQTRCMQLNAWSPQARCAGAWRGAITQVVIYFESHCFLDVCMHRAAPAQSFYG